MAVIAAVGAASGTGFAAQGSRSAVFYCNEVVPAATWCPDHLNIYDSQANWNQSYAQQNGGWPVCERVTIRYQAPNISFRCGGSPVDSGCDLVGYAGTTQFSMYTGNNAPSGYLAQYMVGKAEEIVCD
jgi:hypothetical protein